MKHKGPKKNQVRRFLSFDVQIVVDEHGVVIWKIWGPRGVCGQARGRALILEFGNVEFLRKSALGTEDPRVELQVEKTLGRRGLRGPQKSRQP